MKERLLSLFEREKASDSDGGSLAHFNPSSSDRLSV